MTREVHTAAIPTHLWCPVSVKLEPYLKWIRLQPCCACGRLMESEASHMGPGGSGKGSDTWALPMCGACHRNGSDSVHRLGGVRRWKELHPDFDVAAACMEYVERYLSEGNKLP